MKTVTLHEAKTHLSRLVREALRGEEIVIARGRQPVIRLVPVAEAYPQRKFGTAAGRLSIADDFDQPLDDLDGYQ